MSTQSERDERYFYHKDRVNKIDHAIMLMRHGMISKAHAAELVMGLSDPPPPDTCPYCRKEWESSKYGDYCSSCYGSRE